MSSYIHVDKFCFFGKNDLAVAPLARSAGDRGDGDLLKAGPPIADSPRHRRLQEADGEAQLQRHIRSLLGPSQLSTSGAVRMGMSSSVAPAYSNMPAGRGADGRGEPFSEGISGGAVPLPTAPDTLEPMPTAVTADDPSLAGEAVGSSPSNNFHPTQASEAVDDMGANVLRRDDGANSGLRRTGRGGGRGGGGGPLASLKIGAPRCAFVHTASTYASATANATRGRLGMVGAPPSVAPIPNYHQEGSSDASIGRSRSEAAAFAAFSRKAFSEATGGLALSGPIPSGSGPVGMARDGVGPLVSGSLAAPFPPSAPMISLQQHSSHNGYSNTSAFASSARAFRGAHSGGDAAPLGGRRPMLASVRGSGANSNAQTASSARGLTASDLASASVAGVGGAMTDAVVLWRAGQSRSMARLDGAFGSSAVPLSASSSSAEAAAGRGPRTHNANKAPLASASASLAVEADEWSQPRGRDSIAHHIPPPSPRTRPLLGDVDVGGLRADADAESEGALRQRRRRERRRQREAEATKKKGMLAEAHHNSYGGGNGDEFDDDDADSAASDASNATNTPSMSYLHVQPGGGGFAAAADANASGGSKRRRRRRDRRARGPTPPPVPHDGFGIELSVAPPPLHHLQGGTNTNSGYGGIMAAAGNAHHSLPTATASPLSHSQRLSRAALEALSQATASPYSPPDLQRRGMGNAEEDAGRRAVAGYSHSPHHHKKPTYEGMSDDAGAFDDGDSDASNAGSNGIDATERRRRQSQHTVTSSVRAVHSQTPSAAAAALLNPISTNTNHAREGVPHRWNFQLGSAPPSPPRTPAPREVSLLLGDEADATAHSQRRGSPNGNANRRRQSYVPSSTLLQSFNAPSFPSSPHRRPRSGANSSADGRSIGGSRGGVGIGGRRRTRTGLPSSSQGGRRPRGGSSSNGSVSGGGVGAESAAYTVPPMDTLTAIELAAVRDFREVSALAEDALGSLGYVAERRGFGGTYDRLPARSTYPSLHPLSLAVEVALPMEVAARLSSASHSHSHHNHASQQNDNGPAAEGTGRKPLPPARGKSEKGVGGSSGGGAGRRPRGGDGGGQKGDGVHDHQYVYSTSSEASRGRFWELALEQRLAPPPLQAAPAPLLSMTGAVGGLSSVQQQRLVSESAAATSNAAPAAPKERKVEGGGNVGEPHVPSFVDGDADGDTDDVVKSDEAVAALAPRPPIIVANARRPQQRGVVGSAVTTGAIAAADAARLEAALATVAREAEPVFVRETIGTSKNMLLMMGDANDNDNVTDANTHTSSRHQQPSASRKRGALRSQRERLLVSGVWGRKALDALTAAERKRAQPAASARGAVNAILGSGSSGERKVAEGGGGGDLSFSSSPSRRPLHSVRRERGGGGDSSSSSVSSTSSSASSSDPYSSDGEGGSNDDRDAKGRGRTKKDASSPPQSSRIGRRRARAVAAEEARRAQLRGAQLAQLEAQIARLAREEAEAEGYGDGRRGSSGRRRSSQQSRRKSRRMSESLAAIVASVANPNPHHGASSSRRRSGYATAGALVDPMGALAEAGGSNALLITSLSNAATTTAITSATTSATAMPTATDLALLVSTLGSSNSGGGGGGASGPPSASAVAAAAEALRIFDSGDSEVDKLKAVAKAKTDYLLHTRGDASLFAVGGEETEARTFPSFPFLSAKERATKALLASIYSDAARQKREEAAEEAARRARRGRGRGPTVPSSPTDGGSANAAVAALLASIDNGDDGGGGGDEDALSALLADRAASDRRRRQEAVEEAKKGLERAVAARKLYMNRPAFDVRDDPAPDWRRWKRSAEAVVLAKAEGEGDVSEAALHERMAALWGEAEARVDGSSGGPLPRRGGAEVDDAGDESN